MARYQRRKPITSIKQFRQAWGITVFPRSANPRQIPDTTKHFYPRKRVRPRLSVTLDDIMGILFITTAEALEVMREINSKRYKSPLPFITTKDLAKYMHVGQWHIQHYFVTNELYEHYEMRNKYMRK